MKIYSIENSELKIEFTEYGASVVSFFSKRLNRNIIYSYNDYNKYKENPDFLGTIIGRSAGRIENALIKVGKKEYKLTKNYLNKHNLHGGTGLSSKKFSLEKQESDKIIFYYDSKSGEDGFPGDVRVYVIYKIEANRLILKIKATPKKDTYLNMSSHMSFNLTGEKDILNHTLFINSSKIFKLDNELIPYKIEDITDIFSFKRSKKIGQDIKKDDPDLLLQKGYDLPYLLDSINLKAPSATLMGGNNILNIYTNQNVIVLYTGNYYKEKHKAVSIECQNIPNPERFPEYENINVIKKNETYENVIIYEVISNN